MHFSLYVKLKGKYVKMSMLFYEYHDQNLHGHGDYALQIPSFNEFYILLHTYLLVLILSRIYVDTASSVVSNTCSDTTTDELERNADSKRPEHGHALSDFVRLNHLKSFCHLYHWRWRCRPYPCTCTTSRWILRRYTCL